MLEAIENNLVHHYGSRFWGGVVAMASLSEFVSVDLCDEEHLFEWMTFTVDGEDHAWNPDDGFDTEDDWMTVARALERKYVRR